jgi:hypothetical protein
MSNGLMGKKKYVYDEFVRYASVFNIPLDCTINIGLQSVWFEDEGARDLYCAFEFAFELGYGFGVYR